MPATHLRPRGFFEILDGSVRHYRARFGAMLLPFLPAAALRLVTSLLVAVLQWSMFDSVGNEAPDAETAAGLFAMSGFLLLFSTVVMVAGAMGFGATIHLAAADLAGRRLQPGDAWRETSGRFWALIGLMILVSWIIGFGFFLLIVPGIYLALRFSVSTQVLLLERVNVGDALGRSGELVRGHYGRGFGIMVFLWILTLAFSALPMAMGLGTAFFLDDEGEIGNPIAYFVTLGLGEVVGTLVGLVVWPLMSLAVTHYYWDLRVRKEGLDLRTKLERLDAAEPGVEPAP